MAEENTVGRPTDYSTDMADKAIEYLKLCVDEEVQVIKQTNNDKGYEIFENKIKVKIPTKGGLARYLNVHRDTLYEWAKEHEEFSDIMEAIGAEQEDRLINKGLSGEYTSPITKLLLTKHGYIDKQDVTSDGKAIKGNGIIFSNFKDNEADSK